MCCSCYNIIDTVLYSLAACGPHLCSLCRYILIWSFSPIRISLHSSLELFLLGMGVLKHCEESGTIFCRVSREMTVFHDLLEQLHMVCLQKSYMVCSLTFLLVYILNLIPDSWRRNIHVWKVRNPLFSIWTVALFTVPSNCWLVCFRGNWMFFFSYIHQVDGSHSQILTLRSPSAPLWGFICLHGYRRTM